MSLNQAWNPGHRKRTANDVQINSLPYRKQLQNNHNKLDPFSGVKIALFKTLLDSMNKQTTNFKVKAQLFFV